MRMFEGLAMLSTHVCVVANVRIVVYISNEFVSSIQQ